MRYEYNKKFYNSREDVIKAYDPTLNARIFVANPEIIFDGYNWGREPSATLDDLYCQQAQRIRQSYDYLIALFSGGADSNQVIHSFYDNNIHLDAVFTFYPLGMMNQAKKHPDLIDMQLLLEYDLASLPRLKKYAVSHPNTTYECFDFTDFIKANYDSDKFLIKHSDDLVSAKLIHTLRNDFQVQTIQDYIAKNVPGGKKVGVIYGCDKPLLSRNKDENLVIAFSEMGTYEIVTRTKDITKLNFQPIRFYWDNPDIPCKQGHVTLKALNKDDKFNKSFTTATFHKAIRNSDYFKKLIYPSTFEPVFQQRIKSVYDDNLFGYFFGMYGQNLIEKLKPSSIKDVTEIKQASGKIIFRSKFFTIGHIE